MKIYGREYGFRLSVGAAMEIAELCPGKSLERIEEIMNGSTLESLDFICAMAEIESRAYEQARSFETGDTPKTHLTKEMVRSLDFSTITKLSEEVNGAFFADAKPTVEVDADAVKKKRKPKTAKIRAAEQNE